MELQDDLVAGFRWVHGHADIWPWFADAALFETIVGALAQPFSTDGVTKVVGIEARGFLLAGAVARELKAGVVPIRKPGAILAGTWSSKSTTPDYRGRSIELLLQQGILAGADRVLVVDEWIETGSQMSAAASLVEEVGASLVGVAVIVNESPSDVAHRLPRFHAFIDADLLGSSA